MTEVNQEQLLDAATGLESDSAREQLFWDQLFSAYAQYISDVSPWWSPQRDAELRYFWKDGLYGSALMTLAQSKLASMPMKIEARDKSIASHVQQAAELTVLMKVNSGFGDGWYKTMLPFTEDYLGQDNGAFLEILGGGDSDGPIEGPVLGLRHLDAARCQRTGNPVYPVIYQGMDGRRYKMHFARIFTMTQMPSADQKMRGVGLSSVSRSLRIIESLQNTVNYKDEKMGAKPIQQILIGSGITGKEIIKALAASEVMMDNLGMKGTARTVALGSTAGEISLDKVEMSGLETFNEAATFTFASYALALAWGLEFNEVVPQTGGRQSDIISLQRSRGMLPQQFITGFEEQAAIKLVPPHLVLTLDYKDDQADKEHALITDILSRGYQRQIEAEITTPEVVQSSLHNMGHMSDEQLAAMRLARHVLPNGMPVATVFTDDNYSDVLKIDRKFLSVYGQDGSAAMEAIFNARLAVYEWMGTSPSSRDASKGNAALSALEWLEKEYNKVITAQRMEEGDGDDKPEEMERDTNLNEGEAEKSATPTLGWYMTNHELVNDITGW